MRWTSVSVVAVLCLSCTPEHSAPPSAPPPPARMDAGTSLRPPRVDAGHDAAAPRSPVTSFACGLIGEPVELATDPRRTLELPSVAAGSPGFAFVWSELRGGSVGLFVNGWGADAMLLGERGAGDEGSERAPALVGHRDGYLLFYVDNPDGQGFDLRARSLDAELTVSDRRVQLTTSPEAEERSVSAIVRGDAALIVAWVSSDARAAETRAYAARVDASGAPTGPVRELALPDGSPTSVRLVMGDFGPLAVIADAGHGAVYVQRLTEGGAPEGAPSRVDEGGNVFGGVDATWGIEGGAVVYGDTVSEVRAALRFRALDAQGEPILDERPLGMGALGDTDGSVASIGGGYLVAYRALGDDDTAEIRLAMLSESGLVIDDLAIAGASRDGGAVQVRSAPDGSASLVWGDRQADALHLVGAFVRCRVGSS
ncbi:MAG: hypothetical protein AB7S26_24970 [Sandaracinaceae bacterium]